MRAALLQFAAGIYGLIPNVTSDPETRSAVERVRMKIAERGGLNGIRTLAKIMATMDTSGPRAACSLGLICFGALICGTSRSCRRSQA